MFNRNLTAKYAQQIQKLKLQFASQNDELIKSLICSLDEANNALILDQNSALISNKLKLERQKLFASNIALAKSSIQSFIKLKENDNTRDYVSDDIKLLTSANQLIAFKNTCDIQKYIEKYNLCYETLNKNKTSLAADVASSIIKDRSRCLNLRKGITVALSIALIACLVSELVPPLIIAIPITLLAVAVILALTEVMLEVRPSAKTLQLKDQTKNNTSLRLFDKQVRNCFISSDKEHGVTHNLH